jgi:hypothetical protein
MRPAVRLAAFAAVLALAAVLVPARAGAFCRTTTVKPTVPYEPSTQGCWLQGTPLAWESGARVPYSISAGASAQVDLADATRVAQLAFAAWNSAMCATGNTPDVQVYDNGPVSVDAAANDCGLVQCDPTFHDPQHVIVFDDAAWPHNDPTSTLALTTVTYGVNSGEIYDADMEINTAQHTISPAEPPPPGAYDLQSIMTHEAGHFLGLAHATDTHSIMYSQYQPGAIALTQDDVDGICTIYPQHPAAKAGCACESAPAGPGSLALTACAALGLLVGVRRARRRGEAPR